MVKGWKRLKFSLYRSIACREVMIIRKKRSPMASGRGRGNIHYFIVLLILPECAFHDSCSFCLLFCCSFQILLWSLFLFLPPSLLSASCLEHLTHTIMDIWIELDLKYLPRTELQQAIVSVTLAVMVCSKRRFKSSDSWSQSSVSHNLLMIHVCILSLTSLMSLYPEKGTEAFKLIVMEKH